MAKEQERKTPKRKSIMVDVSPETHARVKIRATQKGMTIRDFVLELVEQELSKKA